jgi:signal peptidase II
MKKNTSIKWLWLSLVLIILDQGTKFSAIHYLAFNQPVRLLPFLNLTLEHNPGAAFSFLAQAGDWQGWLFGMVAILVCIFIARWLYKIPAGKIWLPMGLSLIIGGAIGNVADRIMHGYVIDFLDFYVNNWHWPTFNFADSAICIGAAMLIIDFIRRP